MSLSTYNFFSRWFLSTNHKDIGVLYFILVLLRCSGTMMSVLIRMELAHPGSQILAGNNQLYNVLVTGTPF
jgi:cytochrome c oxidase subunit 1